MKLKIEFVNGIIEVLLVERVRVDMNWKKLQFIYDKSKKAIGYKLGMISRVTVDSEVIYDKDDEN